MAGFFATSGKIAGGDPEEVAASSHAGDGRVTPTVVLRKVKKGLVAEGACLTGCSAASAARSRLVSVRL